MCQLGLLGAIIAVLASLSAGSGVGHILFAISLFLIGMPHGFQDAMIIWSQKNWLRACIEYLVITLVLNQNKCI